MFPIVIVETVKLAGTLAAVGAVKFQVTGAGEMIIEELVLGVNVPDAVLNEYVPIWSNCNVLKVATPETAATEVVPDNDPGPLAFDTVMLPLKLLSIELSALLASTENVAKELATYPEEGMPTNVNCVAKPTTPKVDEVPGDKLSPDVTLAVKVTPVPAFGKVTPETTTELESAFMVPVIVPPIEPAKPFVDNEKVVF